MDTHRFGSKPLFTWDSWEAITPTPWTYAGHLSLGEPEHANLASSLGVSAPAVSDADPAHPGAFLQALFFGLSGCFEYPYPSDGDGTFQGFHGAQKTRLRGRIELNKEYVMRIRLAEKVARPTSTGLIFEAWMHDPEVGIPVVFFNWQQRFIPLSKLVR